MLFATIATLVFVPSVFALLHGRKSGGKQQLALQNEINLCTPEMEQTLMETDQRTRILKPPDEDVATPTIPTNAVSVRSSSCRIGAAILDRYFTVLLTLQGIHTRSVAEGRTDEGNTKGCNPYRWMSFIPPWGCSPTEVVLPASVQGFIDSPVYARTSGYLLHWYADIGTHVRKGELLAEIQTPELDQQVQQAQSDLATAQANYQLAADHGADRWQKLLQKNAVSQQETDQATSDLNAKRAAVSAQEANVRRLQQLQGFEKIYAPFDGVITARNTDIGDLIQAGENTTPQELFHLSAIDRLRVFVPVPEIYQSVLKFREDRLAFHPTLTQGTVLRGRLQGARTPSIRFRAH